MAKYNIAEFAVEQEGTPGTVETFVQADVLVRLRDGYVIAPDHELIDLNELSSVSTSTAAVLGRRSIAFTVSYVLRGPGDLVTAPAIQDLLEAALFEGTAAKSNNIGAVASGPFEAGEVITSDGTGSPTGLVLQETANGASSIPYIPLSGTIGNSEGLTGGTSGATATTSSTANDAGMGFRPADWSSGTGHHASCRGLVDGQQWTARGCLADLTIALENGGPGIVTQNFMGAWSSYGDQAVFGVTSFPEASTTVPKFLDGSIDVGTYQPTGVNNITINWPTNPTLIEDANDSSGDGVLYCDYNRQAAVPTITMEVDQVAAATKNYFTELQTPTIQKVEFTLGSSSGAIWTFSAPSAQLRTIGVTSRDPQRGTYALEFGLTGSNNEELLIWQH